MGRDMDLWSHLVALYQCCSKGRSDPQHGPWHVAGNGRVPTVLCQHLVLWIEQQVGHGWVQETVPSLGRLAAPREVHIVRSVIIKKGHMSVLVMRRVPKSRVQLAGCMWVLYGHVAGPFGMPRAAPDAS